MTNKHSVALVFALLLGGLHLVWSLLVLSGFGQTLSDFVFWAHMIHVDVVIGPFDLVAAVTLVLMTTVVGYILGYLGAWVWNRMHS